MDHPEAERYRLERLRAYELLDSEAEPAYDAFTKLAAATCGTPISLISLVDERRQWFKANVGLEGVSETPRDLAFCAHAIRGEGLFEINDATKDPRFQENALVLGEPHIRFYAGVPLVVEPGAALGTLCVIDRVPRTLTDAQRSQLKLLAEALVELVRSRRVAAERTALAEQLARVAFALDQSTDMIFVTDATPASDGGPFITYANETCVRETGYARERLIGKSPSAFWGPETDRGVTGAIARSIARGAPAAGEFLAYRADGTSFWSDFHGRPIRNGGGEIQGWIAVGSNVDERRRQDDALLHGRERFRSLFDRSPHAIGAVTIDGIITDVNSQWEQLTGYRSDELIGRSALELVPENWRAAGQKRIHALRESKGASYEAVLLCRDGREVPVEVDATVINVGGANEGYFITMRDLTFQRALERRLSEKDERVSALYRVAASSNAAGFQIDETLALGARALQMEYGFVTRVEGTMLTVHRRFGPDDGLLPIGTRMPLTKSIGRRLQESSRALAIDDLTVEPYASELRERGLPWTSYIGSRLVVDRERFGAMLFTSAKHRERPFDEADIDFIDLMASMIGGAVTRDTYEIKLRELAMRDAVTGAANRAMLEEHLDRAIAHAKRARGRFALHYFDLDDFKAINDEFGHAAGDDVLRETARRLQTLVRGQDVVARVGGDEFVVLQSEIDADGAAARLTERLHELFAEPVPLSSGASVRVGCSAGAASYPEDGDSAGALLRAADAQMYAVKKNRPARPA